MMATSLPPVPARRIVRGKRRVSFEQLIPPLVLTPTVIAILIFVYGFILTTLVVSLSNWGTLKMDLSLREPLLQNYADMFEMGRFQADLRNTLVFTVLFLLASVGSGLLLAIFLDQQVFGSTF